MLNNTLKTNLFEVLTAKGMTDVVVKAHKTAVINSRRAEAKCFKNSDTKHVKVRKNHAPEYTGKPSPFVEPTKTVKATNIAKLNKALKPRIAMTLNALQFFGGDEDKMIKDVKEYRSEESRRKNEQRYLNRKLKAQEAEWARKELNKKDYYRVPVVEFEKESGKDDAAVVAVIKADQIPSSEMTRAFDKVYRYTKLAHAKMNIKNMDNVLKIKFGLNFEDVKIYDTLYKDKDQYYTAVEESVLNTIKTRKQDNTIKGYINIVTKQYVSALSDVAVEMMPVGEGASGFRKGSCWYIPTNDVRMIEILSEASHGILEELGFSDTFDGEGKEVGYQSLQKICARIFQCAAPSYVIGKIHNPAVYFGIFGDQTIEKLQEDVADALFASIYALFEDEDTAKELKALTIDKLVQDPRVTDKVDKDTLDIMKETIDEITSFKGTADGVAFILKRLIGKLDAIQARPMSTKVFVPGITAALMNVLVNRLDRKPIYLNAETMTASERELFRTAFDAKDSTHPYYRRVVVIQSTKNKQVEFLGDLNSYKAPFKVTADGFELPVLDVPAVSKAHYSKQLLSKGLEIDYKPMFDHILECVQKECDKILENIRGGGTIDIKQAKSFYFGGAVAKLAPEYMNIDAALKRSQVRLALNSFSELVNRCRISSEESAIQRVLPDLGAFFGKRIIKKDEIVTNDVKEGTEVLVIKYPTNTAREYWVATIVSPQTIEKRIMEDADIAADEKKAVCSYYRNISKGSCIMANSHVLMKILAGMDFDFDSIAIFWNSALVQTMKKTKPEMVNIIKDKISKPALYKLNLKNLARPLINVVASGAQNVGLLTTEFDIPKMLGIAFMSTSDQKDKERLCETLMALLDKCIIADSTDPLDDDIKEVIFNTHKTRKPVVFAQYNGIRALSAALKDNAPVRLEVCKRHGAYKGLEIIEGPVTDYVMVDATEKARIRKELRCAVITPDTFMKVIRDISSIAHHDQEIVIDFAKTGITTDKFIGFLRFASLMGNYRYEYNISENNNAIERNIKTKSGYLVETSKYVIMDVYQKIRNKAELYFLPKVNEILAEETDWDTLDRITTSVHQSIKKDDRKFIFMLSNLSSMYGQVAQANYQLMADTMDENLTKKGKSAMFYEALYAMSRSVMSNLSFASTPTERGLLALYISKTICTAKHGFEIHNKMTREGNRTINGFGSNVFGKDLSATACAYFNGGFMPVLEGLKAYSSDVAEDVDLYFDNGVARNEDGDILAIARECITGEFTVVNQDGKLYAGKDMQDFVDFDDYNTDVAVVALQEKPSVGLKLKTCSKETTEGNAKGYRIVGTNRMIEKHSILSERLWNITKGVVFEVVDVIDAVVNKQKVYYALVSLVEGAYEYPDTLTAEYTIEEEEITYDMAAESQDELIDEEIEDAEEEIETTDDYYDDNSYGATSDDDYDYSSGDDDDLC